MSDKNKVDLYNSQKLLNNALERLKEDKSLLPEHKKLVFKIDGLLKAQGLSAKRRKKYSFALPVLLRKLGKPLEKVTQRDLEKLVTWIEQGGQSDWSESTKEDYKQILKHSWKVANGYDKEDKPKIIRFIKSRKVVTPPEWLPSDSLVEKAIDCSLNPRDKFIIAALREGGFRTAELCYMNIGHWREDGQLIEVTVPKQGKTGMRVLYMRDVIPFFKQWLQVHPNRNNPESPLIINLEGSRFAQRMKPFAVMKVVRTAFRRAGSPRDVSIQLLRKRNSTEMAGKLTAEQLNDRQGWVQGSKMAGYYVKFSKTQKKKAARKLYGLEETEEKDRSIKCINPLCKELNPSGQKFCWKCHTAVSVDSAFEVKKLRDMINKDQAEFYKSGDINWILTRIEARLEALEGKK